IAPARRRRHRVCHTANSPTTIPDFFGSLGEIVVRQPRRLSALSSRSPIELLPTSPDQTKINSGLVVGLLAVWTNRDVAASAAVRLSKRGGVAQHPTARPRQQPPAPLLSLARRDHVLAALVARRVHDDPVDRVGAIEPERQPIAGVDPALDDHL